MPGGAGELDLPDFHDLRRGHLTYFPVAPGRLEFAAAVRRKILSERPRVVVVELPGWLEPQYRRAIERLPQISVIVYQDPLDDERGIYVPIEPADPFTEAVRSALEIGAQVIFAEPDIGERPHLTDFFPDPYSVRFIGLDKYVETYRIHPPERTDEVAAHAAGMAWKIQGADPFAEVLVVLSLNMLDAVLDAMEEPREPPPKGRAFREVDLINPHPDSLAEITIEYPFLQERYERFRDPLGDDDDVDRRRVQYALFKEAEGDYAKNTGEKLSHWQRRMLARYTRNLAMMNRDLVASLFDLTVAARSIVDDNYAWEVWNTASRYFAQREVADIRTENLSGEEVWLQHAPVAAAAPAAASQTAPAAGESQDAEEGEAARRVGRAARRQCDLFVPARGPRDRGLRPFPQAEGTQHRLRGAGTRRAVHDDDPRRHRHPRDHPQLARAQDLRPPVPEAGRRGGRAGGHLRRGPEQRVLLPDDLARRAPERVRHGLLLDAPVRPDRWVRASAGPSTAAS